MHPDSLALCRIRPAFPDIFIGGRAIMTMAARPKKMDSGPKRFVRLL